MARKVGSKESRVNLNFWSQQAMNGASAGYFQQSLLLFVGKIPCKTNLQLNPINHSKLRVGISGILSGDSGI